MAGNIFLFVVALGLVCLGCKWLYDNVEVKKK